MTHAGLHGAAVARAMWRRLRTGWPLVVLAAVVVPLLWLAISVVVRAGLFGLSGPPPDARQLGAFLTFIGAGLGTVATVFAALLTRRHNARERHRLRLEAVLKSLDSLPENETKPRLAGILSTMVLLGHERVAIRVLQPAWDADLVDDATATWLIGQVLTGHGPGDTADSDRVDVHAVNEAAVLLVDHEEKLTGENKGRFSFPGYFLQRWVTEPELPTQAKFHLLLAMGQMLVFRGRSWWSRAGALPGWPTIVLLDCVENEREVDVRSSAAVLLAALHECFPGNKIPAEMMRPVLRLASDPKTQDSVPDGYLEIARRIKAEWREPAAVSS